jgi:hypothetical protein
MVTDRTSGVIGLGGIKVNWPTVFYCFKNSKTVQF